MTNRDSYKHLLNLAANFITLIFQTAAFGFVLYKFYIADLGNVFYRRGNWAVVGLYALLMFFFTNSLEGYKIGYRRISDIVLSDVLAILATGFVQYFVLDIVYRDYLDVGPILIMVLVEIVMIVPWVVIVRKLYAKLYPPRDMLLIYGQYSPADLMSKLATRSDKYEISEQVKLDESNLAELRAKALNYSGVVLHDLPAEERNVLLKFCYENGIRTYVTPKISDIIFHAAEDIHLFDTPLYLTRNQGLSIGQRFVKRAFDIIFGIIGFIIASPFMLIIALCIKLYDGGPVFYTQERLTRDNKPFKIYKFRSMTTDSEKKGARLAAKNDSRVTPVGKVIRAIHFDEIPQILNIIKGDMSIVGPRPERAVIRDEYKEEIPEFDFRLKVKAGLTGYAQVYGKYNTTPYDKLKMDITYIENYSLALDIKIILLTVKILFQKENTEGVDSTQKTAIKTNDNKN